MTRDVHSLTLTKVENSIFTLKNDHVLYQHEQQSTYLSRETRLLCFGHHCAHFLPDPLCLQSVDLVSSSFNLLLLLGNTKPVLEKFNCLYD